MAALTLGEGPKVVPKRKKEPQGSRLSKAPFAAHDGECPEGLPPINRESCRSFLLLASHGKPFAEFNL